MGLPVPLPACFQFAITHFVDHGPGAFQPWRMLVIALLPSFPLQIIVAWTHPRQPILAA